MCDSVKSHYQLGNTGKPLHSMNFDEIHKNVILVDQSGQLLQDPSSDHFNFIFCKVNSEEESSRHNIILLPIFSSFLSKLGMIHSLTCPHTHHQNEVVEIKHHDIVEFGFSLRSQPYASLPLSFWDHAFETTVYLINRLP